MTFPEIIIVGNVEFLFAGMALALGMPKMARRILSGRYGGGEKATDDSNDAQ